MTARGDRAHSPPYDMLRLTLGIAGLAATAALARRPTVGGIERAAFRTVNGLPEDPTHLVWAVMQCGSLGAAPAAGAIGWGAGDRALARRLLCAGGGAWLAAKLVKRAVRRPRPAELVPAVTCRGSAATGLGYLSGHAAVVTALAAVAAPKLPRQLRPAVGAIVPIVAAARVYVGAHLPLDVVGGASLGLALGALANLASGRGRNGARPDAITR